MPANHNEIEKRLWQAADELRANSKLKSSEYAIPVLGLIFLRYASEKFAETERQLQEKRGKRREIGPTDYQARGAIYLPEASRFENLLKLPEGSNLGGAINLAMTLIANNNPKLEGVLPKSYQSLENDLLATLLKTFSAIPMMEGDVFGKIYEYFLGEFAKAEGSKGGEFFTPTSLVKLIVEVIEPFHGRIFDPACGSGGMFVQSAHFVENHHKNPNAEIMVYGQEKTEETVRLCKMNLAVHGLEGDIRQGNSYYEDIHDSVGKFDFVMANPPFNVDRIDKERLKDDKARFPFGMPRTDNGNYIWIQKFFSALNESGRAGFVMANSASDARASELEIRTKLIESGAVDVMISIGSNFFYTVTLPCTLWFFDKAKANTSRKDKVLFIDARHLYRQVDRAHRDFSPEQIEFIANIARLYRDEQPELKDGSEAMLKEKFPSLKYHDVAGLCRVATAKDIGAQGWSLNPGRYVGVTERERDDFDFVQRLEKLNEELEMLNAEAAVLQETISNNVVGLLDRG
ncbi:MAG: type I restriction-modification system subunit M [Pyrinomonadaceae bacterium]